MAGIISSPDFHDSVGDTDRRDMISDLHDSILHVILSLLPVKDAVRTSILAKRWRYLWTYLSAFDFEVHSCESIPYKEKKRELYRSAYSLFHLVGRLLRKSNCVKRLHIAIHDEIDVHDYQVSDLIREAAVKNTVEDLTLFISQRFHFCLPRSFSALESLNKLNLRLRSVLFVFNGICFPSLKTLNLSCVTFGNGMSVQHLFSGCLVLRELTLHNCYWRKIKQISLTLSTLRILTIHYVDHNKAVLRNCTVKIDAANLLTFRCTSYLTVEFVLVNLTSIVDAHIDVACWCYSPSERLFAAPRAMKLFSGLGSVKSLTLSNYTLEVCLAGC